MSSTEISWAESERPLNLGGVIGHEEEVKEIGNFLEFKQADNWLLEGEPGTGKTTLAMIIASAFLDRDELELDDIGFESLDFGEGKQLYKFNASSDRGISVIRDEIGPLLNQPGKKVFIMDEADMMTKAAQNALRGFMQDAVNAGKIFILTCNHIDQIEDAIKSRCRVLHINRLSDKNIGKGLMRVLQNKGIAYTLDSATKSFLTDLIKSANGDMRKAIQTLQRSCVGGVLNTEDRFFDLPIYREGTDQFLGILDKILEEGKWLGVEEHLKDALNGKKNGKRLNPHQAVRDSHTWLNGLLYRQEISESVYFHSLSAIKEADYRLVRGTSKSLQLIGMLAEIRMWVVAEKTHLKSDEEAIYCGDCGERTKPHWKHCPECGSSQVEEEEEEEPQALV